MRAASQPWRLLPGLLPSITLLCLAVALASPAQDLQPRLGSIQITGLKRYSAAQVRTVARLQTGQMFDAAQLEVTAQSLAGTGAFEEVRYRYAPAGDEVAVEFIVREASNFHRCVFDNFVGPASQELDQELRQMVPLYDGFAPESGSLLDEIAEALQELSREQGVAAQVERTQYGALGSADWEHVFTLTGVNFKIQEVRFQGGSGVDEAALRREVLPLTGRNYSVTYGRAFAGAALVPLFRKGGYLAVKIGDISARFVPSAAGEERNVQATFLIEEGLSYRWGGVEWTGNQAVSSSDLNVGFGLQLGAVADGLKIDSGWESAGKLYQKKGYLELNVGTDPVYDAANQRVTYRASVSEGPQYHMGTLSFPGLPDNLARELQRQWSLKAGAVYDASYGAKFLEDQAGPILGRALGRAPTVQEQIRLNRAQQTVDVTILVR